jgi:four helix bundle protein
MQILKKTLISLDRLEEHLFLYHQILQKALKKNTDKEFIYFLYVAKASAGEVRSQLYLTFDLDYITKEEFEKLLESVTEISKLLSGFIKYLSKV